MPLPKINTGIVGLDNVLGGGFPIDRLYLIEGDPGTGKTTLAIQFLMEGAQHGERVLFLSLSETEVELRTVALSHGWTLEGIDIFELSAAQQNRPAEQNTLFHPSEVELNEVTQLLLDQVERLNPTRVVVDSLSELRLLAQNPLRLRRQILALKQFFAGRKCTVLLLDDLTAGDDNGQAHSLAHGVMSMEQPAPDYGSERRRLRVMKLRGVKFRGGWHDYSITTGGLVVFPRLVASEHRPEVKNENITSGIPELDALCGGGVSRGTSMLIIGPAGAGKTTIAMQFASAAMRRGEHTAVFLFDENLQTLMARCSSVGMNVRDDREKGLLTAQQIDPAEMPPGEFSHIVRGAVERKRARVVVIDSLNGYMNAMPQERFLLVHMHELLTYLAHQGVLTILTMAQHGLIGNMESPIDLSYLSDAVLSVRYFESRGEIMQSSAVLKKRTGPHERTLREFRVTQQGIRIGAPLRDFHGVLTGVPVFAGGNTTLFKGEHA